MLFAWIDAKEVESKGKLILPVWPTATVTELIGIAEFVTKL